MYIALAPHAIGVRVRDLPEAIAAARTGGFEGVEFAVEEVAGLVEQHGADHVRGLFADAGVRPAAWSLPTNWRGDEETWRGDLEKLPRLASVAAAIGCPRTTTWVLPSSDEREFDENYRFHVERFTPVAQILADHGCRLGLEFVGPKTMRDSQRHPFIYTMEGMLAMGAEIGSNVGLLLDCWHWYTSGGTLEELRAVRPEQIVYIHVNDAPTGVPVEEQVDSVRALPGETGVIDITGFLQAVRAIGYDGPVTPEPFKQELGDLPSDAARLELVGAAMERVFRDAGLRAG
ncbi:MAG: sugar phosphate isomerase/epimerase [Chloroflexota bacterium]|nr:sugar phosphate isomerase/epimerase [Chloroflexota bacterium]